MKITRRQAIEKIVSLTALALAGSAVVGAEAAAERGDDTEQLHGIRAAARAEYFRLIPIWHKLPEGSEKERIWKDSYVAGVVSGILASLRNPEEDLASGLDVLPLASYHLPEWECDRLLKLGWQ